MSDAPKNTEPLPDSGKMTSVDRDDLSFGGLPPMESLGKDLHTAGVGGADGQGVVFNPTLALHSRIPPKGGWLGEEAPGPMEPLQGLPPKEVVDQSVADRTAARFELERAMILAIERDPSVVDDLLAAHTSDDPAVMAKGDAILDATVTGLRPDHVDAMRLKRAFSFGGGLTPFELLTARGELTKVADYLIRNHGIDGGQFLADDDSPIRIAGSPAMYDVLSRAKEELCDTGTLRPFDLASMKISAPAPVTDRNFDGGTRNDPGLK